MPNKVVLRGQLIAWDKESPKQFVGLTAIIKGDGQFLTQTTIDTSGQFILTFPTSQYKTFDVFVTGIGIDTSFIETFTAFKTDTISDKFIFPKMLEFQIFRCPRCKHGDKAYDIVYGDKQKITMKVVKGDTIYSNIVDRKYYAGTCVQSKLSPHFYCDRCKIKW
jgi:hypothetical protein